MKGKLIVRPMSAKLTYDTEVFGKMDPYAVIKCGTQTFKTKSANDMGKTPVWHEMFEIQIQGQDSLQVSIFDKDVGSEDDFICDGTITLTSVFQGGVAEQWFPLFRKGKSAGQIQVKLEFQPFGGLQQPFGVPPQQPYGYPTQPGYGYPPQQPGYGYPPQQPGYGYPPQQPGYGYPPQPGYGYPPQQPGYGYPPYPPGQYPPK